MKIKVGLFLWALGFGLGTWNLVRPPCAVASEIEVQKSDF